MSAIKNYVAAISAGLFVASCSQQPANQQNSKPKSVLTQDTYNLALFAAAEDFETLTESAFSADIPAREMLIDRAIKATDQVANFASPALTTRLQALLADIRAAQTDDAPADIAIASVEAFRELVSAVSGEQQIPVNVSLLDYAGFRFDAEAQAKPARFSDMQVTVRYAQAQWKGIESRKEIASLSPKFAASLTSMERAAQSGNIAKARAAAIVELDLVDELEKAFSTPPKG